MSAIELENFLINSYDYKYFKDFIIKSFGENIGVKNETYYTYKEGNIIESYAQVCEHITLDSSKLGVYVFKTRSINAKVGLHKELQSILKESTNLNALLAVFYDKESQEFRLSLLTGGYDYEANRSIFSNPRRQTFVLGHSKIKTAKSQLQKFIDREKSLESLKEAFSVEPVTKEFYNKYEELYKNLSKKLCENTAVFNVLQGYEGLNEEKAINAFVKKLLGRIVFLYFLQKKGWLGVAQNTSYGKGDKNFLSSIFSKATQNNESFYAKYLCPLFFETLNTERKNDYSPHFDCKIPFLNGGLFEEYQDKQGKSIERDFVLTQSLENTDFEAIFNVFESYNFTIEESTPDNQEVGIDPEMLGKVFENLIDYNKESGAFYTPREIVHFMCKNILTCTLQEKISREQKDKDSLYNFIFYKRNDDFITQNAHKLTQAITSFKILDPAIGSGAFPMGMLSEILEALHTLNPSLQKQDLARLKREIIEKQIYGIDIDADAIEIAKLRFWLSIAVDEDTPSPLPNLDFKFMQGNALIESVNGIEIISSDLNAPQCQKNLLGRGENASLFDKSQTDKLEALFLQYYEPNAQKAQFKAEILAIMKEAFDERKKEINMLISARENNPKSKPKERAKQQEEILQYQIFKQDLDAFLKDYEENNFHTDKLFLYRFFFAPVFQNGGFDIIIGNPPYIRQEKIPHKEALLKEFENFTCKDKLYKFANSSADIFIYFYAKSLSLLKNGGFLSFITSNKWCRAGYGKNLREFILDFKLISHYDFNGVKVFENATVDTAITTLQCCVPNKDYSLHFLSFTKEDNDISEVIKNKQWLIPQNTLSSEGFIFSDSKLAALKAKIERLGTPLKDWDININYGIKTGYNEAFIIDTKKREEILSCCKDKSERERTEELIKPILRGRDIKRYSYEWAGLWIILAKFDSHKYLEKDYPAIYNYLLRHKDKLQARGQCRYARGNKADTGKGYSGQHHWLELDNNPKDSYLCEFAKPKIVYSEIVREPQFYLDNGEFRFGYFYAEATSFILSGNESFESSLEYLLGILHSKLATFAFKEFYAGGGLGESGYRYKKAFLEKLPIPKIAKKQEKEFVKIVNEMIECKKENVALKDLESMIDYMFFSLYGLNDDEIKLISNGGGATYSLALLLLACVESQLIILVKLLCENFELELKEAFRFCEGLQVPSIEKQAKISWQRVTQEPSFIVESDYYLLDSMAFLTHYSLSELHYLLGFLNSKAIFYYFKHIGHLYSDKGFLLSNQYVERFPIPKTSDIDAQIHREILACVKEILEIKNAYHSEILQSKTQESHNPPTNPIRKGMGDSSTDTSKLESHLDSLIYQAYNLTQDEIALIESEFATRERTEIIENLYYLLESFVRDSNTQYRGKIIWAEMTNAPCFTYDTKGFYINQTCYFIPTDNKYLCAILNSKLIYFYMRQIASNLGDGAFRWIKQYIEKLPIPKITKSNQHLADRIVALVDAILNLKAKDSTTNTNDLEFQIDKLVYELYNLAEAEIQIINNV